jgi:hypothetical protein
MSEREKRMCRADAYRPREIHACPMPDSLIFLFPTGEKRKIRAVRSFHLCRSQSIIGDRHCNLLKLKLMIVMCSSRESISNFDKAGSHQR